MKFKTEYQLFAKQLKIACKQLKCKLSFEVDHPFVDDEITFTIDGIEYFIVPFAAVTPPQKGGYYAATVIVYDGNREEPPSSDEKVLMGGPKEKPENLLMRILDYHWNVKKQWVFESLYPEYS